MKKVALILHGFPGLAVNSPIRKYFKDKNWKIIVPQLFAFGYIFSEKEILENIKKSVGKNKPSLVIGISMGGLLLPKVVKLFPRSKVLMIATGPKFDFKIPLLNKLHKSRSLDLLIVFLKYLPTTLHKIFYRIFNPNKEGEAYKNNYEDNLSETIKMFKSINNEKMKEVLMFLQNYTYTTNMWCWNNKSLIFIGENDRLMPLNFSEILKTNLKNSQHIINKNRLHYDAFDERDFDKLDKFLNSK